MAFRPHIAKEVRGGKVGPSQAAPEGWRGKQREKGKGQKGTAVGGESSREEKRKISEID